MTPYFYISLEAYSCFSNFSPHGLEMDGKWWPSRVHYWQAQKFAGSPLEEGIRLATTPRQAAAMRRAAEMTLLDRREQAKVALIRRAVRHKLVAHDDLRKTVIDMGAKCWWKTRRATIAGAVGVVERQKHAPQTLMDVQVEWRAGAKWAPNQRGLLCGSQCAACDSALTPRSLPRGHAPNRAA